MANFDYIIIGAGLAGDSAVEGIRQVDRKGTIALFSEEKCLPYRRPDLSKALWKGKPLDEVWRKTVREKVELFLGRKVLMIDVQKRTVTDDKNQPHGYDKLLIATGGVPRRLDFESSNVIYYRTLDDYRRLRRLADERQRFGIIGSGFIAAELAAALVQNGRQVVMIFPGQFIGDHMFPQDLARFVTEYYRQQGVVIRAGEKVFDVQPRGEELAIRSSAGVDILVDGVVVGIGIRPNTELAVQAWLKTDDGIVVDELLRTSSPAIFAAGDVAEFANPALRQRLRVEHEDNA
ncbi:MAG: NAD(P)/FAD-dependent oxidoreductase, partial [candidate division WOR-3 bacterium]